MKLYKYLTIAAFCVLAFTQTGCFNSSEQSQVPDNGQGGSLARFAVVGDFLYVVDINSLSQYNISNPDEMIFVRDIVIENGVETIFPKGDHLFIGTQNGMYIYEMTDNGDLSYVSQYNHIVSCDPVVVNDDFAFVTLRSGDPCRLGFTNELQVINIKDLTFPHLVFTHNMDFPKGLGIDDNTLFVCDGDHLKVFDSTNPSNLTSITQIDDIIPNDVILLGELALVISPNKLYQYDYSDVNNIFKVSELGIQ
jgi:hypothetical protein